METAASNLKIRRFKTIVEEGLVVIEYLRVRMGNPHHSRGSRGVREPGVRRRCGAICARVGLLMCPSTSGRLAFRALAFLGEGCWEVRGYIGEIKLTSVGVARVGGAP